MFDRLKLLISEDDLTYIGTKAILIVGVGGVGGACFEALVRSGFKNITVIDGDCFDNSNLNRQLLSNANNIGNFKASEACLRALSINPDISVTEYKMFLSEANFDQIKNFTDFDYIIDCCDTVATKLLLIKKALEYKIKIISAMGTGNRLDPTKVVISNIWQTNYDPLAKVMRKLLRDNKISYKLPVVTSTEIPIKTHQRTPGSTCFVPNTAGLCLASYVFNDIIKYRK